jgi:hypothetical protein
MTDGKRATTICKTLHRKLKIEQHEPHYELELNSNTSEVLAVLDLNVTPVVLLLNDTNII